MSYAYSGKINNNNSSHNNSIEQYIPSDPPTPSNEHPYASTDGFAPHDFVGRDHASQRDVYPPNSGEYEKGLNPVTRGSIAAQMVAEGQIPKKEGLKMYRADEHAGALFRGGKARCCGRVCVCSIILVLVILVSIVASFLLWTRPPDVTFNGVEAPASGSEVTTQSNGFILNFQLNIGVVNPNFFGVTFKEIKATGAYSTAPTKNLGGGSLSDVTIPKNSNTTIHFPFTINYTLSQDSDLSIAKDIAKKCGFTGSTASDLTIDYTVTLSLKILSTVISPSFSSSTSFACPLSESDLSSVLGSLVSRDYIPPALEARTIDEYDSRELERRSLESEASRAVAIVMRRGMEEAVKGWQNLGKRWSGMNGEL